MKWYYGINQGKNRYTFSGSSESNNYQVPIGYSRSAEKQKEFYVYRKVEDCSLFSHHDNIKEASDGVFQALGENATIIMVSILSDLDVEYLKINKLFKNGLKKSESRLALPFTSCVELFSYSGGGKSCESHRQRKKSSSPNFRVHRDLCKNLRSENERVGRPIACSSNKIERRRKIE